MNEQEGIPEKELPATSSDAPIDLPASDLGAVIEESKAAIAETPPIEVKKRGRKKGGKNAPKEDAPPDLALPPQVSLAPMLGKVASIPYAIAATRTRFEGFKLSNDESMEIGTSLDLVVQKYFPNLSEKAGVGVMACFTVLSTTLVKMQMYEMWQAERMKVVESVANEKVAPLRTVQDSPLMEQATASADHFFK